MKNTPFIIEYYASLSDRKTKKLTQASAPPLTDHNGCIQWIETYKYKYTHRSFLIGLKRWIRPAGKSMISGKSEITLAVNPWLKEGSPNPEILDMSSVNYDASHGMLTDDKYKEDGLKFLSEISKKEFPQLWVRQLSIHDISDVTSDNLIKSAGESVFTDYGKICEDEDVLPSNERMGTESCHGFKFFEKAECLGAKREKAKARCKEQYEECKANADKEHEACLQKYESDLKNCKRKKSKKSVNSCQEKIKRSESECHQQKREHIVNRCNKERDENLLDFEKALDAEARQQLKSYQIRCDKHKANHCYKRFVELGIKIPLELRRYDIDGNFMNENLSGGTYDINVQFVSEDNNSFYFMA